LTVGYEEVKNSKKLRELVEQSNKVLEVIGYTDHGPRHTGYVSRIAGEILKKLGMPPRRVELAKIAGWVHDVGNMINRNYHGFSGAALVFPILCEMGFAVSEACEICTAIGMHEEETGMPVSDISAALIIADKTDAHKARVRGNKTVSYGIHDRVNFSIKSTKLVVAEKMISIDYSMNDTASPMEFLSIYLTRMQMCEKSAAFLGCSFALYINGVKLNRWEDLDDV